MGEFDERVASPDAGDGMNQCDVPDCPRAAQWSQAFAARLCGWHYLDAFERELGIAPQPERIDPADVRRRR